MRFERLPSAADPDAWREGGPLMEYEYTGTSPTRCQKETKRERAHPLTWGGECWDWRYFVVVVVVVAVCVLFPCFAFKF